MIDEIKAAIDQDRAQRAQDLLGNELLKEAFTKLRAEYINAWENSTRVADQAAREKLWHAVHIVRKIEDHLKLIVQQGKITTRQLAEIKHQKR